MTGHAEDQNTSMQWFSKSLSFLAEQSNRKPQLPQNNKGTQLTDKRQYVTLSMIILTVNNFDSPNKDANGTIGFKNQDPTISACKKHTSLQEKYTD